MSHAELPIRPPLGHEQIVTVEVEGHLLKARHAGEVSPNEQVYLQVDWTRAHLFDPQTGALLEKATEELRRLSAEARPYASLQGKPQP